MSLLVEVFDSEQEAAEAAAGIADAGEGAIDGVQRADGTYTDREQWEAYIAEVERRDALFDQHLAEQASRPEPPTRVVRPPFAINRTVTVPADTPAWVGRPLASRA